MISKEEHSLAVEALEKMGKDVHYTASHTEQQAMLALAEEQGQEALKAVLDRDSVPCFRYNLSSMSCPTFGCITLNHEKIHHIENVDEFYRALGLTDELRVSGILAEEFIWNEYHREGSAKSEVCLQVRIIKYLMRHSESFARQYAAQCNYWLASCMKKCNGDPSACAGCACNPN